MTTTYMIHAWCMRPFIATIDIEADTPDEAVKKARTERQWLYDTAEECNGKYPWDEFASYDEDGNELLHVLDDSACLRNAAPALLKALTACSNYMADALDESDENESRIFCQARAAIAKAGAVPPLPEQDAALTCADHFLSDIAKEHLGIPTLETQRSDSFDFHDVAVWQVEAALKAAFDAGLRYTRTNAANQPSDGDHRN